MEETTATVEAEINEELEATSGTSDATDEESETWETTATEAQANKKNKFAKLLAEKNEALRQKEAIEIERDVALIKAKYGNDVDEGKIQEIKAKHKDLSNDEVYAIYSLNAPAKEVEVKQPNMKVVWQKPSTTTNRVYKYSDLSKVSQAEYNDIMSKVAQWKAVIKAEI